MKWGIVGSGQMAAKFAEDLARVPGAKLVGVANPNNASTARFTAKYGGTAFAALEDLLEADVDVLYVATPHPSHKDHAISAIERGKAVLCEKPFAMNRSEAAEVIALARKNGVFVMEAMWTRFLPAIRRMVEVVRSGRIGEIQRIETNFGYHFPFTPSHRVYDPKLGGGGLLDVGVYCVSFAQMLLPDLPLEISTTVEIGRSGVDEEAEWTLKYASGAVARGRSSLRENTNQEAVIVGSKGVIRIPRFWCPQEYSIDGVTESFRFDGQGFRFEAEEVAACLAAGNLESAILPLADTLKVMTILDRIRDQWGRQ